ncbi:MAG: ferredoxin [Bacillota bacterium]|nr:ferredoxin [Bacillota bacterium]
MPKKVNKDLCIGCGACVGLCPAVFSFDDEGKAEAAPVEDGAADDAQASCPVGAIEEA